MVEGQEAFEKLYYAFRAREKRRGVPARTHPRSQIAREIIQAWRYRDCPTTYHGVQFAADWRLCVYLDAESRAILASQAQRFDRNRSSAFRAMAVELAFGGSREPTC